MKFIIVSALLAIALLAIGLIYIHSQPEVVVARFVRMIFCTP